MRRSCLALVWLSVLVSLSALVYADFPYNGSFEQLDKGLPVGWEPQGTWLSWSPGGYDGAKYIYLADTVGQAGDRLVSQGYRLAAPPAIRSRCIWPTQPRKAARWWGCSRAMHWGTRWATKP